MQRLAVVLACCLPLLPATASALPPWTEAGVVAPGRQFAAVRDKTSVHIIAEGYVQIDATGAQLRNEAAVTDGRQSVLDMYPAIALGPDQSVHVVTRHGGDYTAGHQLRYTRRAPEGGWGAPLNIAAPVPRNYTVGVVALPSGRVLVSHGRLVDDVGNVIDLYAVDSGVSVALGTTPLGWLRADGDHRLRAFGDTVMLASGTPGPGAMDPVHLAVAADGDGDVIAQWEASHRGLLGGSPRRGGPSLSFDDMGRVWVGYGGLETHHVESLALDGSPLAGPVQTHDDMGTYHLGYGNGAVEVSPDGMRVVAVALRNADDDEASDDAELVYSESMDAGLTFGPVTTTGLEADGGDGRMRPRLLQVEGTLLLLYRDDAVGGIAAASTPWFEPEPEPEPTTSGTSGVGDTGPTSAGADEGTSGGSPTTGPQTGSGGGTDASGVDTGGGLNPGFPGGRGDTDEGCSCATKPSSPTAPLPLLVLFGLVGLRRRRS